jgi:hypothetical protein
VSACVPEKLDEKVRSAVDHLGLVAEFSVQLTMPRSLTTRLTRLRSPRACLIEAKGGKRETWETDKRGRKYRIADF